MVKDDVLDVLNLASLPLVRSEGLGACFSTLIG